MSGTFPTAGFTTLDFQSVNNNKVTTSISGRTQRIKTGVQYWSFKLESPPLDRNDFFSQYSFIVQQEGQVESFTIVPPVVGSTSGTATGTITISDDYAAGVTTCRSTGGSGTLKKGDVIKFSNHDKVYMLTADVNLNQTDSTEDVISFYPTLTTAITNTTTITYNNVPFTVYFNSDNLSYTTGADGKYRYQINCNEEI